MRMTCFLQEHHAYREPILGGATCLLRLDENVQPDLRAPFDILQFHRKHSNLFFGQGNRWMRSAAAEFGLAFLMECFNPLTEIF